MKDANAILDAEISLSDSLNEIVHLYDRLSWEDSRGEMIRVFRRVMDIAQKGASHHDPALDRIAIICCKMPLNAPKRRIVRTLATIAFIAAND